MSETSQGTDCASLNIVSDVCLTIQAPVVEWYRHWSRKHVNKDPGRVRSPVRPHLSFSLYYHLPTAKQL